LGPLRRREFLRAGTLAMGGLSLAEILAARAAARDTASSAADRAVILFWMWGGPSQLETYDLKPHAPSEYRGPFRPIATTVPGMEICELFPQQAAQAHRFSLVRSLHHEMSSHNDGSIELLTGKTPAKADPTSTARSEHPDLGHVASRLLGSRGGGLPQYIGIPEQPFMTQPTYLGLSHKAFETGDPSVERFQPPNLTIGAGLNGGRMDDRRGLVAQLDRLRRGLDLRGDLTATDEFRGQAFDLLTSTSVGRAGFRQSPGKQAALSPQMPAEKILIVAVGEFGRTPRLTANSGYIGRDHWPGAQTALVSGGGLRMGQVVGATNSKAEYPAERPLRPQDLLATIYRHLGIDHRAALADFSGRPVHILPSGEPIDELI
jgi:hypothetical protein